jgi:hypothetical protein
MADSGKPIMTEPHPPPPCTRAPRWFITLGFIALAAYAVLIGVNSTVAAGGSDSSGYLNSARLLASGRLENTVRLPPGFGPVEDLFRPFFQPLGHVAFAENSRLLPTYPNGLPLHLALAGKIFGWSWGTLFVELAGALAAIWLCYAIGRELGLDWALAGAAAVVFAACPVTILLAVQPLSDLLATTWCLAAVWAALRARRHLGWGVACGAAYGVAVLVRPTNLILMPALLVLLGFNWRKLACVVLGGLPAAAWLAFYNHNVYGGALRSGYMNWSEFFDLSYFKPTAWHFVRWLAVFLPAVLLVLPLAAIWRRDTRTRELLALALWFSAIVGLYLFCAFSHESWTCLRYILPAMPALILAGMLGVEAIARSVRSHWAVRVRTIAAFVIAVWAAGVSWKWSPANGVFHVKIYEDAYTSATTAARTLFPKNTLVLCCQTSGAVYYYTGFPILRWDALNPAEFAVHVAKAQRAGVTICALLFTGEEQRALREMCPGKWTRLATVDSMSLWRLTPPEVK